MGGGGGGGGEGRGGGQAYAGSDSYPVRIGWETLARSGPDDFCTLACFGTGSVWLKPDTVSQNQNLMGSGLVLHNVIRDICRRMEPSLEVRKWQRAGYVLAHEPASVGTYLAKP